jgi:murein DD-endopeptidase MepM/ murein hydrolase activator NlpD
LSTKNLRERLLITISDINGTKHYTVSQFISRFAIKLAIVFVIIFLLALLVINFLFDRVDDIEAKKEQVEEQYNKLAKKNIDLESKIDNKSKELKQLNSKIEDLEDIVGIDANSIQSLNFDERVDLAKLTTIEKKFIMTQIPSGYPIENKGVSSSFGWRKHPVLKKKDFHPGIDLRATRKTPVYAPANGVVEYAGRHAKGYGTLIIIHHNYGFKTLYGHLNRVKVKTGDIIQKGQLIALSGNTGLSSGPHLHYEIRYVGIALEPAHFLKWEMKNFDTLFKKQRRVKWQSLVNQIKQNRLAKVLEQQS